MWMIIFLLLPILALGYVGWHIWTLVPLPAAFRTVLLILLGGSFLLLFCNLSRAIDGMPLWLARIVYDVGNSSIFVLLYLTIIFLLLDLGRIIQLVPRELLHHSFYTTAAIVVILAAVFLYGNIHYHHKKRIPLTLQSNKPLAHPLKLVMMSDLHLGYHNQRRELSRWVDMINSERPDMVLIAGDIIDMSMRPLIDENMAEEIQRIEAPVYACLGNHEYYTGEPKAQKFYRDAHIHLLRDTSIVVGDVCLLARDDRSNHHRLPLSQIAKKADHSKYTILLDHQPYHLEQTEKEGIDFQLSGHTHEGQVWPISWITHALYECAFGEYQRGKTHYYISSGMGIWGGKFRIGTHSEYVVATLQ